MHLRIFLINKKYSVCSTLFIILNVFRNTSNSQAWFAKMCYNISRVIGRYLFGWFKLSTYSYICLYLWIKIISSSNNCKKLFIINHEHMCVACCMFVNMNKSISSTNQPWNVIYEIKYVPLARMIATCSKTKPKFKLE